jgi:anti-anti-sigma factor
VVGQFYTHDSEISDCVVVTLHGELDLATAPALRAQLAQLISDGQVRVVLDFGHLDFIDASGLGALTAVAGLLRSRDGWLRLVGVRSHTRRVMRILGIGDELSTYQCLDDAIAGSGAAYAARPSVDR